MSDEVNQSTPDSGASESSAAEPSIREAASQAVDASQSSSQEAAPQRDSRPASQSQPKQDDAPKWDSVDPRLRTEYETTQKRWKDAQTALNRQSQEWKSKEGKLKEYETGHQRYTQLERLYNQNQKVQAAIDEALGRKPTNNVDPDLAEDPLYKYISERDHGLRQEMRPVMEWVQQQQEQARTQERESFVDKATDAAVKKFESYMGRKPSDQEVAKIYAHMVDRKVYDGESAAVSVFQEEILQAKVQAALNAQMAKKNIGTKVSTVNGAKAASTKDYEGMGMRDIVAGALEEMGIT